MPFVGVYAPCFFVRDYKCRNFFNQTIKIRMKNYNQSPLPFQGQKRNFVRLFREHLTRFDETFTYVDLFGGSGLLSHTVKTVYPKAKVVYNDFDNFTLRLSSISKTNKLLEQLRVVLANYPRKQLVVGQARADVLGVIKQAASAGYVDYITLSSNLLFSMNFAVNFKALSSESIYNKVRLNNYDAAGYLEGVSVVRDDYKLIFNEFKDSDRVVFLVDPPYLSTDTATYSSDGYWKLRDYLDVLQVLVNQNYFYFTSNKSQIVELCEWISSVSTTANPFAQAVRNEHRTYTSHNTGYVDIMYHYKRNDNE